MNDIARHPAAINAAVSARRRDPRDAQEEAFLIIDPLFSDLHKQHSEAANNHKRLVRRHGQNDPMTRVAEDISDSTKSALETRLLELREDEEICAQAALIMKKREAEEDKMEVERKALAKIRETFLNLEQDKTMRRQRQRSEKDSEMAMWVMIWAMRKIMESHRANFMALARDFTDATDPRRTVAA